MIIPTDVVLFIVSGGMCLLCGLLANDVLNPKVSNLDKTACLFAFTLISFLSMTILLSSLTFWFGKILLHPEAVSTIAAITMYLILALYGYYSAERKR